MANYHILDGKADGNQVRVVFHLPVPDAANVVGTNYRDALAMYLGGERSSVVPVALLGSGEQDALDAGSLYEHIWQFNTQPEQTLPEKRDILDARYTAFSSAVIERLQAQLEYYGHGRDVP